MSIESLAIALNHSAASGTVKIVMLGIANHDGDGGAWPSVATLARYANVDVRNVKRALRKLEELGEIRSLPGQGGDHKTPDHKRPNLYRILLACPPECDRTAQHRMPKPVAQASPLERVADSSPGGEGVTSGDGAGVTQTILLTPLPIVKEPAIDARGVETCTKGHPIIDRTPSGTPFCALGCTVAA